MFLLFDYVLKHVRILCNLYYTNRLDRSFTLFPFKSDRDLANIRNLHWYRFSANSAGRCFGLDSIGTLIIASPIGIFYANANFYSISTNSCSPTTNI